MSNPRVESDNYDPNLIPAETAARREREGAGYKQVPDESGESIDTSGGYTVDQEGLVNNYPIEPEMYIEEPGDLREEQEAEAARRRAELREINQTDEKGQVTSDVDTRGKGVGQI
ncbi:hypothetical protein IQ254_15290 [Nodosilinea sp. LEGE 07088]|uniref:hypothetical protein n=1 Tax=Nodosilinea sp. LEGE 07088 TaxID=2777968 RepID=UPI001881C517|nr:hypothetical protein [Nodosilinea sp. LEGE 07088]MBE9138538.1 hypothetical protein [Nodosilinea sp. LEGE 07088]